MDRKFRAKSKNRSTVLCVAVGICAGMMISVLLAALAAILISKEILSVSLIRHIGIVSMAISAFVSLQLGGRLATEKKLLSGACSAIGYYLFLLALTILFFDGRFLGLGGGTIGFFIGGGFSALLLVKPLGSGFKRNKRLFSR